MLRPRPRRRWRTTPCGSRRAATADGAPASWRVSALGGIAYLADFAIGANIGIAYGTATRCWASAIFAVVIFLTGFPLAYYAARYNIDLDLITRGRGFGYYGSVVTNVIFATFTFIFFALEGSIMAQGLKLGLHIPLWLGYAGLHADDLPAGDLRHEGAGQAAGVDHAAVAAADGAAVRLPADQPPDSVSTFFAYKGENGSEGVNLGSVMLAAGVCLSLIAQIAEQIDYLRFMPPKTPENSRRWWSAVILAGPGWVIFGAIKQVDRPVPGRLHHRQRRRRRRRSPTSRCTSSWRSTGT